MKSFRYGLSSATMMTAVLFIAGCTRQEPQHDEESLITPSGPQQLPLREPVPVLGLRVTDVSGNQFELTNASIDYTVYGFVYTPDNLSDGFRMYQGEAVTQINWKQVEILTIGQQAGDRLNAVLVLKGKKPRDVQLRLATKGLNGTTDLGKCSIALEKIRTIVPFEAPAKEDKKQSYQSIKEWRLRDTSGTDVALASVAIDYTDYPEPGPIMHYQPDIESGGVRVLIGASTVTVAWSRIKELTLREHGGKLEGDLVLVDGEACKTEVKADSKGIAGPMKLGQYTVRLKALQTITPVDGQSETSADASRSVSRLLVTERPNGSQVEIRDFSIDYTNYPLGGGFGMTFYMPDMEKNGVRIQYGSAAIMVPWGRIERLTVKSMAMAEIVLMGGEPIAVSLAAFSREGLRGTSPAGPRSWRPEQIASVVPAP